MSAVQPAFNKKDFEEPDILRALNRIFTKKRGVVFKLPPPGSPVILLTSGGLDSTCLWFLLIVRFGLKVYPLHIVSKQSPRGQVDSLSFFSRYFRKKFGKLYYPPYTVRLESLVNMRNDTHISGDSLDIPFILSNLAYYRSNKSYRLHTITSPSRLGRFIFTAYEYAHLLRYKHAVELSTIFVGIVPEDNRIIRESTLTTLRSINLSFCLIMGDFRWQFTGPLERTAGLYSTKRALVRFAFTHGLPVERTWSCVKNGSVQCGICPSCIDRRETFQKLRVVDKTRYRLSLPFLELKKKLSSITKRIRDREGKGKISISLLPHHILSPSPFVQSYSTQGKTYLFHTKKGTLQKLNGVGGVIWYQMKKHKHISLRALLVSLEKTYTVSPKKLKDDVISFLTQLISEDYIRVLSSSPQL